MTALAFIPARAGSKRFPGKNVARLGGTPLVAWAINSALAARQHGIVDDILVSTNDDEAKRIAREFGAAVHWRPDSLCGDEVHLVDVLRYYAQERNVQYFCLLLPTSPLRRLRHLIESRILLERTKAEVVMSLVPWPHSPWWAVQLTREGFVLPQWPGEHWTTTRPPTLYRHDGAVLWIDARRLRRGGEIYGENVLGYVVDPAESCDIDTPRDLIVAEQILQSRMKGEDHGNENRE